jgi:hypothetical protein
MGLRFCCKHWVAAESSKNQTPKHPDGLELWISRTRGCEKVLETKSLFGKMARTGNFTRGRRSGTPNYKNQLVFEAVETIRPISMQDW